MGPGKQLLDKNEKRTGNALSLNPILSFFEFSGKRTQRFSYTLYAHGTIFFGIIVPEKFYLKLFYKIGRITFHLLPS